MCERAGLQALRYLCVPHRSAGLATVEGTEVEAVSELEDQAEAA